MKNQPQCGAHPRRHSGEPVDTPPSVASRPNSLRLHHEVHLRVRARSELTATRRVTS